MKVTDALREAKTRLGELDNPSLEAEVLLCAVLDCERVWLKTHGEENLSEEQFLLYKNFIQKRSDGVPVAYICGYKDWCGMRLEVNEDVLIPRDETEILCNYVVEELRSYRATELPSLKILDIGTGSGAIACALGRQFGEWNMECRILGLDISEQALEVARRNFESLELEGVLLKSDLLEAIEEGSQWDIIVANLPYVPEDLEVSKEVQKEPHGAIFSGVDGLDHYRRLFTQLNKKNVQFKSLWIEFLPMQQEKIGEIFPGFSVEFFTDSGVEVFFARIY